MWLAHIPRMKHTVHLSEHTIVKMIDKNKTTMTMMMYTKNKNKMNVLLTVFEW